MNPSSQVGLAVVACVACAGAHAGLLGTQVTLQYNFNTTTIAQSFLAGSAPEITCTGGGAGNADVCSVLNNAGSTQVVDIFDNGFSYALSGATAAFAPVTPNAFTFVQLAGFGPIGGVSLSTNISGLSTSRLSFNAGSVSVNMSGLTVGNGQGWTVVLQPVPEPQTWATLMAGLVVVGGLVRRGT